ncbi:MAG: hypothetical protein AAGD07_19380 [Planctomycetota bacterium]
MSNQPVRTFKAGSISAKVWENQTKFGVRYTTTVAKTYKTTDGQFKTSDSFDAADLPVVEKLVAQAFPVAQALNEEAQLLKAEESMADAGIDEDVAAVSTEE